MLKEVFLGSPPICSPSGPPRKRAGLCGAFPELFLANPRLSGQLDRLVTHHRPLFRSQREAFTDPHSSGATVCSPSPSSSPQNCPRPVLHLPCRHRCISLWRTVGQRAALRCRPAFCTVVSPACLACVSLSPVFSCKPSEGRGDAALACCPLRVLALPPASSARSLCTHAEPAVPFPPGELPHRRRGSARSDPPCSLWSPSCDGLGPGTWQF